MVICPPIYLYILSHCVTRCFSVIKKWYFSVSAIVGNKCFKGNKYGSGNLQLSWVTMWLQVLDNHFHPFYLQIRFSNYLQSKGLILLLQSLVYGCFIFFSFPFLLAEYSSCCGVWYKLGIRRCFELAIEFNSKTEEFCSSNCLLFSYLVSG